MIMLGQACPPPHQSDMDAQKGEQVWQNVSHRHQLHAIYHEIAAWVFRGKYVPAPIPLRREIAAGQLGVGEIVLKYIFMMLLFW